MRGVCSQSECDRPAYGRGLCSRHYQLARYHGKLPTVRPPRPCEECGQEFTGRKWNARYCSDQCEQRVRYRQTRQPARRAEACEQCGAPLDHRSHRARFCSGKCGNAWHNARRREQWLAANVEAGRTCKGCGGPLPAHARSDQHYCSTACKIASRRHEAYGLTKQELRLLLAQHEQCAICGSGEWGRKGPQVDHCHETGRVRGVLCGNCNQGLGRFADDPARLRAAADYLERVAA